MPADQQHRCADVVWAPPRPIAPVESFDGLEGDLLMNLLAHLNPPGYSSIGVVNTPAWRSAQIGSTCGHASASGVARIYDALLQPGRLVSPDLLAFATAPGPRGTARSSTTTSRSASGSSRPRPAVRSAPTRAASGTSAPAARSGFADPDAGVAFGYVMNHVIPRWQSSRNRVLIDATYAGCSAAPSSPA